MEDGWVMVAEAVPGAERAAEVSDVRQLVKNEEEGRKRGCVEERENRLSQDL